MNQAPKKDFVLRHIEELVNQKDTSTIPRNFAPTFLDHGGPNGGQVPTGQKREFHGFVQWRIAEVKFR